MKIAYVVHARIPTEKAHGISIAHMCASFAKAVAEVELVIPARKNAITDDIFSYYGVPKNFSVRALSTTDFLGGGLTGSFWFLLQRILFLFTLSKAAISADVIYTREPEIAWFYGKSHTVVYEAHRWPHGFSGVLTAWLIRHVALVVANSRGTEAAVQKAGSVRTLIAPNGFDPTAFAAMPGKKEARTALGLPEEGKVAMYVGSLEVKKGLETLYAAAPLLTDVQIVVVGAGEAEVQNKYTAVRFLGYRPYRELASVLAAADVLVLPNSAHDEESLKFTSPIKLFAYLASGVPIVASDLPSIREIVSPEVVTFVPPDNAGALADGVRNAMASDGQSQKAREVAKGYTWDARAQKILAAL